MAPLPKLPRLASISPLMECWWKRMILSEQMLGCWSRYRILDTQAEPAWSGARRMERDLGSLCTLTTHSPFTPRYGGGGHRKWREPLSQKLDSQRLLSASLITRTLPAYLASGNERP